MHKVYKVKSMRIEKFEDIISWQKSKKFTVDIYKSFNNLKDFAFRSQIERASASIMNNIAEGFERKSHKDFEKFLFIAKGSCGEVRSLLSLAFELNYIDREEHERLYSNAIEISKLLSGLIKSLSTLNTLQTLKTKVPEGRL
ncbi:MAG: four helix bundle protein [Patescibacteria group bacterium]|nr:four helix bundle protein [Patescibacteria group bacterium]